MNKVVLSIGVFFIISIVLFVGGGLLLPKKYNISYTTETKRATKEIIKDVANLELWERWFIFNKNNAKIKIQNQTMYITTNKNKKITIFDIKIQGNTISCIMKATDNIVYMSFVIYPSLIKGTLKGEVSSLIMGGYINIFVKSSLDSILKSSLNKLSTIRKTI